MIICILGPVLPLLWPGTRYSDVQSRTSIQLSKRVMEKAPEGVVGGTYIQLHLFDFFITHFCLLSPTQMAATSLLMAPLLVQSS